MDLHHINLFTQEIESKASHANSAVFKLPGNAQPLFLEEHDCSFEKFLVCVLFLKLHGLWDLLSFPLIFLSSS